VEQSFAAVDLVGSRRTHQEQEMIEITHWLQVCSTLLGYVGLGVLVLGLVILVVRMGTQHSHQDRRNRELDARRRIRERDGVVADRAADDLVAIGEERQATTQAVGEWKLLLLLVAFVFAFLAWSLSNNV
jgi:hypothetical protein